MKKRWIWVCLVVLVMGAVFVWSLTSEGNKSASAPISFDLTEGATLYQDYCAACHGADLEGQPGWQSAGPDNVFPAPPHDETGHTWHHSDTVLFDYTKWGGAEALARQGVDFQSGMPAFDADLTDDQIRAILAFIKSTWPQDLQDAQAQRNAEETEETR